jgi:transposase
MVHQTSFKLICPAGLVIDRINLEADLMLICARSSATGSACPECGLASSRIHSRYVWCLADLPAQGHAVRLNVQVRRFRCDNAGCGRRIFGETLAETLATRAARRTSRLENIVHHLGLALGGRPAAGLARRLMLPVSRDTLLRVVRRRAMELTTDVRVLGIDDFAWKGGQRYGTVLCDLERRRIIDLLPDREAGTVEAWLASHPNIAIVSRDRGAG